MEITDSTHMVTFEDDERPQRVSFVVPAEPKVAAAPPQPRVGLLDQIGWMNAMIWTVVAVLLALTGLVSLA